MRRAKFKYLTKNNIVSFIGNLFERCGNEEYLGEAVTMAEHMLQGATLAQERGYQDIIIVATLLHDIGHFTSEFGAFGMSDTADKYHEVAGARSLESFLPSAVTDCIRYHVAAKRYLCRVRTDYNKNLSIASQHSLNLQGGAMTAEEALEFEKIENLEKIIQVRTLDDAGKKPGMKTPNFWYYAPMIQHLINQHKSY